MNIKNILCTKLHIIAILRTAADIPVKVQCKCPGPDTSHVVFISGRLLGLEGRLDTGAWVRKVMGDGSSVILQDRRHYVTHIHTKRKKKKKKDSDKSHLGITVSQVQCFAG